MPAFSISGKSALITGAGSGIGYSFAALLLSKGCNVLIADLSLRPEAQVLLETGYAGGARAVFHKTEVTEWAQLEAAIAAGAREFGRIDIFVPCAGVYEPPWSSFWRPPGSESSADSQHANGYRSLDINLTHPVRLTQLGLAHLLSHTRTPTTAPPSPPGTIILVSSIAAQEVGPLTPLYNAAKAGISSLTRSLGALEAHVGVRVAAIAPGLVLTPLWSESPEKMAFVDETRDEWVTPEEVAAAMLALIQDDKVGEDEVRGGTVLEVGKGSTRVVGVLHDEGPSGPGLGASGRGDSVEKLVERLVGGDWGG